MTTYDIYTRFQMPLGEGTSFRPRALGVPISEVAERCGLDASEIEWAIEEYGRCDTDDLTIVEHGDTPQPEGSP